MPNQTDSQPPDPETTRSSPDAVGSLQTASKLPDVSKVLEAYQAVANVILLATETNPRPSGEIYALLMPSGVPLDFYKQVLELLVLSGRVKLSVGHLVSRTQPPGASVLPTPP